MELKLIEKSVKDSIAAKEKFFNKKNTALVAECAETIVASLSAGGKLMLAGNGGSAADAQHIAAEFINRFEIERPSLPAIALTTDTSILTCIGNDYDFELIFEKQIRALGREGDVLLAISTSGNSENVIKGVVAARKAGIKTIALTGGDGGELAKKADTVLNVAVSSTARIQEVHITIGHIICQLVDHMLFNKVQ